MDDASLPIKHSFQGSTLVLQFPLFSSSLFYDPLIGRAKLLGGGGGGGPTSSDEPLIIGTVVGSSVALLLVLGVLLLGVLVAKIDLKSCYSKSDRSNFNNQVDENNL